MEQGPERRFDSRPGLVIGEVLITLVVLAAFAAALMVAGRDSRRAAMSAQCQGNLRFYSAMTASYGADNADLMWGFSWEKDTPDNPFGLTFSTIQAHADQAVWIMNERGPFSMSSQILTWVPNILYSHLPLLDYADVALPEVRAVCPGDVHRYTWNRDPVGYKDGKHTPRPYQGSTGARPSYAELRWPFSSTYRVGAAMYDRSESPHTRVYPSGQWNTYNVPSNADVGQTRLTDILWPSSKVVVSESHAFHAGQRQAFQDYPEARIAMMMADGSVGVRVTSDANLGWDPRQPANPNPMTYMYSISFRPNEQWEPFPLNGQYTDEVQAHYQWTRGGLAGRDFDGPPAETGQP